MSETSHSPQHSDDQARRNLRGIGFMILATSGFVVSDTMLKIARRELEAGQILFVRGLMGMLIVTAVVFALRQQSVFRHSAAPILVFRSLIEGSVAVLFVIALGPMALADITSVLMMSPLAIVAISALFLGEKVGWRRWMAVAVGFLGVIFVLQPGGNAVPFWAGAAATAAAILVVARDFVTRAIPPGIPSLAATITTTFGTTIAGGAVMLATSGWQPVSTEAYAAMAVAAIFVLIGNYAVITAYRGTEISVVAPFRFSVILLALVLGILVFGDWPTPLGVLGMGLIVASGLYAAHRERVRQREAEQLASEPSLSNRRAD